MDSEFQGLRCFLHPRRTDCARFMAALVWQTAMLALAVLIEGVLRLAKREIRLHE